MYLPNATSSTDSWACSSTASSTRSTTPSRGPSPTSSRRRAFRPPLDAQRLGMSAVTGPPLFAEGATRGAPQALQAADRWHLWHNLGEAAEKGVYRHRGCLRPTLAQPKEPPEEAETAALSPWPTGHRFAERTRAKHATIHSLLAAGHTKRSIARQLGMALNTILRFSRATTPEEMSRQWQSRATRPDDYKPCLDSAGRRLHQRLETVGEDQRTGLSTRIAASANVSRTFPAAPPVGPRPPPARAVTRWILTHPDALPESDRLHLRAALANCPD